MQLALAEPVVTCDVDWAPWQAIDRQLQQQQLKSDQTQPCWAPPVHAMLSRPRIDQHCVEWHRMRQTMLTASNAGSVCGVNKYMSSQAVFRTKTGQQTSEAKPNMATRHGHECEDEARECVAKVTGLQLVRDAQTSKAIDVGLLQHQTFKWLGASPDGVFTCGLLLEIKCPLTRRIAHSVPDEYFPQLQVQLEVAELDYCVFAQYKRASVFAAGELDILLVPRDRAWFQHHFQLHFLPFWHRVEAYLAKSGPNSTESLIENLDLPVPVTASSSNKRKRAAVKRLPADTEKPKKPLTAAQVRKSAARAAVDE
jgi:putative phage-type endonuclease